jgi:hypothetical protein
VCCQNLPVRDPVDVVAYRLAMPHIAPWVVGLDEPEYAQLRREAIVAVTPHVNEWRPAAIIFSGRVGP